MVQYVISIIGERYDEDHPNAAYMGKKFDIKRGECSNNAIEVPFK